MSRRSRYHVLRRMQLTLGAKGLLNMHCDQTQSLRMVCADLYQRAHHTSTPPFFYGPDSLLNRRRLCPNLTP